MPKFQSKPPTPFFLTHAKILWTHATHSKMSTQATYAIFLTHAKLFWTDASNATHATHAILADLPQTFVALQLPLYYLEQLHQPAVKN